MGKPAWRQDVRNEAGKLLGGQRLTLTAAGALGNREEISGESLTLTAQQVDNAQGKMVAGQDANLTSQQGLNNTAGWLEAGNTLRQDQWRLEQSGRHCTRWPSDHRHRADSRQYRWPVAVWWDLGLDTVGNILNRTGKLTAQQALDIRGAIPACLTTTAAHCKAAAICLSAGRPVDQPRRRVVLGGERFSDADGGWDNKTVP